MSDILVTGYVTGPRFASNIADEIRPVAEKEGVEFELKSSTRWFTQRTDFVFAGDMVTVDILVRALKNTCGRTCGYVLGIETRSYM